MNLLRSWLAVVVCCLISADRLPAQTESSDLKVFGYFQPQFFYETDSGTTPARNSFVIQQLNLFLQKDHGPRLTSFVNFESVNSYSSDQGWGSFRLEEAWVRYRQSRNLNVRLGLQIPIFNNLNEIKNRTPLIPYVIRPLAYEASYVDIIPIRVFVPQQAYAQAFGWMPVGNLKVDYAAYLGNTELINSSFNTGPEGRPLGQTGVDTTTSMMIGGRVGIRYAEFKAGISATSDKSAVFDGAAEVTGFAPQRYKSIPRRRIGADASYYLEGLFVEAEWIHVYFDEPQEIDLDLAFYYVTVGYRLSERLVAYAGYWTTEERARLLRDREMITVRAPVVGAAYTIEDQVTLKVQYGHVDLDVDYTAPVGNFTGTNTFDHFSIAVSVAF